MNMFGRNETMAIAALALHSLAGRGARINNDSDNAVPKLKHKSGHR